MIWFVYMQRNDATQYYNIWFYDKVELSKTVVKTNESKQRKPIDQ